MVKDSERAPLTFRRRPLYEELRNHGGALWLSPIACLDNARETQSSVFQRLRTVSKPYPFTGWTLRGERKLDRRIAV
jgi:hypothetical protein